MTTTSKRWPLNAVSQSFFLLFLLLAVAAANSSRQPPPPPPPEASCTAEASRRGPTPPFVTIPDPWLPSSIRVADLPVQNVTSYLHVLSHEERSSGSSRGEDEPEGSSADDEDNGRPVIFHPVVIGQLPLFDAVHARTVVAAARQAWHDGVWTNQFTLVQRIATVRRFLNEAFIAPNQRDDDDSLSLRDELAHILQWEIGKNVADAYNEVDRTAAFVENALQLAERASDLTGAWSTVGSNRFFIKRAAIGVVLALAPFNYPLNECYATVLPALIMGNIVVLKIPTTGGLVHLKTFAALAKHLPPGTIHFVAGSGRATMPAIMATGHVDALAFIGGSRAADELIQAHPHPHRLKTFLQLEAKNLGIVLPDRRWRDYDRYETVLRPHVDQLVTGALSYNGQRCTAIKLIFVPDNDDDDTTANLIVAKIVDKVRGLPIGLPWQQHSTGGASSSSSSSTTVYSTITPLPNHDRVRYLQSLLRDAVEKGATIYYGGDMIGGANSTLMRPAVVYPVSPGMRLYSEEQFGPIVAIAKYNAVDDLLDYARHSDHAQQVALFGYDTVMIQQLIDAWGSVYGKICINTVPGRSPDTIPFAGRKSSALGVMSIRDALFEFSIPTVIAAPAGETAGTAMVLDALMTTTRFLQTTTTAAATTTSAPE